MFRLALVAIACAGCSKVFDLDELQAPVDAPACAAGDEDCDGQPNTTDICPAVADTATDDSDGDLVGDACDPDGTAPVNRRVLFDGFDDASNAWKIKSGNWQLGEGVLSQPVQGDARVELDLVASSPSVEAVIPELALGTEGAVHIFGSSGGSEVRCSVVTADDGTEQVQLTAFLVLEQALLTGSGSVHLLGGQLQDGSFYCRVHHGSGFDVQVTSGPVALQTIDTIGVITSNASATVSSITVFDVP